MKFISTVKNNKSLIFDSKYSVYYVKEGKEWINLGWFENDEFAVFNP